MRSPLPFTALQHGWERVYKPWLQDAHLRIYFFYLFFLLRPFSGHFDTTFYNLSHLHTVDDTRLKLVGKIAESVVIPCHAVASPTRKLRVSTKSDRNYFILSASAWKSQHIKYRALASTKVVKIELSAKVALCSLALLFTRAQSVGWCLGYSGYC